MDAGVSFVVVVQLNPTLQVLTQPRLLTHFYPTFIPQAYPVMSVIVFAVVFSLGYGLQVMAFHPDARISKGNRKNFFRGEMKGTPVV